MRRILYYSLLCLLGVSVNGRTCMEVSHPPTTTAIDRTNGSNNSTELTLTVRQVGSNATTLLQNAVANTDAAALSAFELNGSISKS